MFYSWTVPVNTPVPWIPPGSINSRAVTQQTGLGTTPKTSLGPLQQLGQGWGDPWGDLGVPPSPGAPWAAPRAPFSTTRSSPGFLLPAQGVCVCSAGGIGLIWDGTQLETEND